MKHAKIIILMAVLVTFSLSLLAAPKTFVGYISDNSCGIAGKDTSGVNLTVTPWKHTIDCMKSPASVKSGYGMFMPGITKKSFVYYTFDPNGSDMAKKYIIDKSKQNSAIMVKVIGSINAKTKVMTVSSINMYFQPQNIKKAVNEVKPLDNPK